MVCGCVQVAATVLPHQWQRWNNSSAETSWSAIVVLVLEMTYAWWWVGEYQSAVVAYTDLSGLTNCLNTKRIVVWTSARVGREGRLLLCQSSVRVSREVLLVDFCTVGRVGLLLLMMLLLDESWWRQKVSRFCSCRERLQSERQSWCWESGMWTADTVERVREIVPWTINTHSGVESAGNDRDVLCMMLNVWGHRISVTACRGGQC